MSYAIGADGLVKVRTSTRNLDFHVSGDPATCLGKMFGYLERFTDPPVGYRCANPGALKREKEAIVSGILKINSSLPRPHQIADVLDGFENWGGYDHNPGNDIPSLYARLGGAIVRERYEDAAKLRDEITGIKNLMEK